MHTIVVVGGGLSALLSFLLLGHAFGGWAGVRDGARYFVPFWMICAAVNMWIGTRHGYSWMEEFPIFLAICAVPVLLAGLVWWKLS